MTETTPLTNTQLAAIITGNDLILRELKFTNRDNRLWTRHDIADYCGLAPATVSKYVTCRASFPKPIQMKDIGDRWKAPEVKDWVTRQRGKRLTGEGKPKQGRPRLPH